MVNGRVFRVDTKKFFFECRLRKGFFEWKLFFSRRVPSVGSPQCCSVHVSLHKCTGKVICAIFLATIVPFFFQTLCFGFAHDRRCSELPCLEPLFGELMPAVELTRADGGLMCDTSVRKHVLTVKNKDRFSVPVLDTLPIEMPDKHHVSLFIPVDADLPPQASCPLFCQLSSPFLHLGLRRRTP